MNSMLVKMYELFKLLEINTHDTYFGDVMLNLREKWDTMSEDERKQIFIDFNKDIEIKHYIGDIKWVLYQYICDLQSEDIVIRCGNYAFDKISKLIEIDRKCEHLMPSKMYGKLNGENIVLCQIPKLEKKQIVISKNLDPKISSTDTTICPDDIILYFA